MTVEMAYCPMAGRMCREGLVLESGREELCAMWGEAYRRECSGEVVKLAQGCLVVFALQAVYRMGMKGA